MKATLHGPLPQLTVYRMMATLAEWLGNGERPPSDRRDRQVSTATRLQLIEVVKQWRESGQSDMQLLFRLKTTHIKLPTEMVAAKHCTCDDPGEGACPVHGRENALQDRALKAEAERDEARRELAEVRGDIERMKRGECAKSCFANNQPIPTPLASVEARGKLRWRPAGTHTDVTCEVLIPWTDMYGQTYPKAMLLMAGHPSQYPWIPLYDILAAIEPGGGE